MWKSLSTKTSRHSWPKKSARFVKATTHPERSPYSGDIPPADLEAAYYAQHQRPAAG